MGCKGISSTCGGKHSYATCVKYQGSISEYGDLDHCDCHSTEEVIEDTIKVVDEIYPQVFLEELTPNCLGVEKNKNGHYPIKDVVQALLTKACEDTETGCGCDQVGSQNTDPCSGQITTNILAGKKFGQGTSTINTTSFSNWAPADVVSFTDLTHKVTVPGTYKVTVSLGYSNALGTDNFSVGIGVNTNPPIADPFYQEEVNPLLKSHTFHFIIEGTKKDDILRPLFKNLNGNPVLRSVKVLYEKV